MRKIKRRKVARRRPLMLVLPLWMNRATRSRWNGDIRARSVAVVVAVVVVVVVVVAAVVAPRQGLMLLTSFHPFGTLPFHCTPLHRDWWSALLPKQTKL